MQLWRSQDPQINPNCTDHRSNSLLQRKFRNFIYPTTTRNHKWSSPFYLSCCLEEKFPTGSCVPREEHLRSLSPAKENLLSFQNLMHNLPKKRNFLFFNETQLFLSCMTSVFTLTNSSVVCALASLSAKGSHFWIIMQPLGSETFTPLSFTGLCEAVIINPTVAPPILRDLKAARIPVRKTMASKSSPLARNPAVPYEIFIPVVNDFNGSCQRKWRSEGRVAYLEEEENPRCIVAASSIDDPFLPEIEDPF